MSKDLLNELWRKNVKYTSEIYFEVFYMLHNELHPVQSI